MRRASNRRSRRTREWSGSKRRAIRFSRSSTWKGSRRPRANTKFYRFPITLSPRHGFSGQLNSALEGTRRFLENTHLFALAESLGGVESLINHPALMTHASVPKEQREALGVTDSLVRLSVGVEDLRDLVDDLQFAFAAI